MVMKIEAAEKQLDTAIKLFFENADHLSAYTLAAASREITDDLCEKQKDELYQSALTRLGDPQKVHLSFRDTMEILIKPDHFKEGMRYLKKAQNFLKHADRDHDQELDEVSIKELSFVIYFAITNLALFKKQLSPAMSIFTYWFAAANPSLVKKDAAKDCTFLKTTAEMRKEFPDLFSERTFYIIYEGLKRSAPYLFLKKQQ
jgi:exonuclease VII small subunit